MNTATTCDPLLLSTAEVAERLGCSRSTLYRWLTADGFPRPVKIGVRTKFYAVEIHKWVRANRSLRPEPSQLKQARAKADAEHIGA